MVLHDAHNHLHFAELDADRATVLADLAASPIHHAVVNGTHPDDWAAVTGLAARHAWVVPSFGLHPWDVGRAPADWREQFTARLAVHPAAAVGEIGLDAWLERAAPDDPRLAGGPRPTWTAQIDACAWQLAQAAAHNRPASLHGTDAWGPLHELLRRSARPDRGFLLHAYAGPAELVRGFVALGAYFSFGPAFLDPRRRRARAAFAAVPADRLLVETDAPLAPVPATTQVRTLPARPDGTRLYHPLNLTAAYAGLASLRGEPLEVLAAQVDQNFRRLFAPGAHGGAPSSFTVHRV
jgi:TatD DNase family protein